MVAHSATIVAHSATIVALCATMIVVVLRIQTKEAQ